jgi:cytochrome c556
VTGRTGVFIGVWLLAAAVLGAQNAPEKKPYPIFTVDHFMAAMKTVGQAFTAVNASLPNANNKDVSDAKAYVAITRDRLATTITFWRDRHRDDAVKTLRDTLAKLDALDDAMSADNVDPAAVSAIARQAGAGCQACHQVYREQDPATKAYRVKAEALR